MNNSLRITWPIVALTALLLGAFVGLFALIPESDSISRAALLAVVVTVANGVVAIMTARLGRRVEAKINDVQDLVNGHTSDLIDRIPLANQTPAQRARNRAPALDAGPSLPAQEPRV